MDERFMYEAIKEANKARAQDEVPIGAVIVYKNEIIASGHNLRETSQIALLHAELIAIKAANEVIGSWRLEDCTLYVTLEPCQMCVGAIIQSRIKRVVFGAFDTKAGCVWYIKNLLQDERFNHQLEITHRVLADECSKLLLKFFQELRQRKEKN